MFKICNESSGITPSAIVCCWLIPAIKVEFEIIGVVVFTEVCDCNFDKYEDPVGTY